MNSDEIGGQVAKLFEQQQRGVGEALSQLRDEVAALASDMRTARVELALAINAARTKQPSDINEWWTSLSLIQELQSLVTDLTPIVRERTLR